MKQLLFIVSRPPYAGVGVFEQIETAMVAAVFDAQVSILFRNLGVWNLAPDQSGQRLHRRTMSKILSGLGEYDIERLYVCQDALDNSGLVLSDELPLEALDAQGQAHLIQDCDSVIGFQS
ncbi:MAG TPA: hypothetical protein DDZ38_09440 [Gammaproteobacteria bacterium]|nr:hypothetical protein [Gammaproteobacteria bacterium]